MRYVTEFFGKTLQTIRRRKGTSQRELAKLIGVDFSYISKIENGRLPPPAADRVIAIAKALGVAPARLLALTGKLPSRVEETVGSSSAAQEFLLEAQQHDLTDAHWRRLSNTLRRLR
jgi:transcriptional regulator with XRE-family HTH domain